MGQELRYLRSSERLLYLCLSDSCFTYLNDTLLEVNDGAPWLSHNPVSLRSELVIQATQGVAYVIIDGRFLLLSSSAVDICSFYINGNSVMGWTPHFCDLSSLKWSQVFELLFYIYTHLILTEPVGRSLLLPRVVVIYVCIALRLFQWHPHGNSHCCRLL